MQVLVIGPFPEPIFGVSLSNMVLTNGLIRKGVKVKTINTSSSKAINSIQGEWNFKKLSFIKHYLQLYKVLTSDVIYCTTGQTFLGILKYAPFVLLAKILNRKSIVHVKGGYLKSSYENMSYLKKIISKFILQLYSKGIVLSDSLRPLLDEFLDSENIFIQHNFIQQSLILPEKEVFKRKRFDSLKVIFLSNLIPEKGIYQFLDSLEYLNSKGTKFEAKIAGHIPNNHESLKQRMHKIKNLEFIGVVQGNSKADLLSWGNIFCLPTYYSMEGQPISILEAMGFGNLIVTTKHAGIPDVCNKKNGSFVEKGNVQSLVNELNYLTNNMSWVKETCRFNLTQARKLYSEEAFVNGILQIIKTK
ncbi:MAG: glycosyltransferase family 4 protein [Flavobacteriaceae bacterium]|nr:glycosyltransferase family 4 protein [Flavobacteriaceae bacterium]